MTDFDSPDSNEPEDQDRVWWPEGYDLPAFRIKRETYGASDGGDWTRGSAGVTTEALAVRTPSTDDVTQDGVKTGVIHVRPTDYSTVEIRWGWPSTHTTWVEVAIVRSAFGHPSTPQDGETILRKMRVEYELAGSALMDPPIHYDGPLPSGHWYYYSVFFRTNPIDWVLAMQDCCVLPRDYMHRDHMWNVVPPFYQGMDQQFDRNNLRHFLSLFGFAMDNTREFVEGLLDLHYVDKTPHTLLKGLGANFGLPYEAGIGDIRYRGLVANAPVAQHNRGTAVGLVNVIEAVSKYEAELTGSPTLMMYPDDTDFFTTTGNWGGMHPDSVPFIEPQLSTATTSYVRLNGTNGTFITGPGIQLGGTKVFRWELDISMDDWTPVANSVAMNQYATPSSSWQLVGMTTGGLMNLWISPDGTSVINYGSATYNAYADGSRHTVGGTWTADNGTNSTVQFTNDGAAFGTLVTGARVPGGMVNGSGPIDIGKDAGPTGRVTGNVYGMRLYADGVLRASPDFTKMTAGQTTVIDAQGNWWVLQGAAAATNPVPTTLTWDKVFLARSKAAPPPGGGRGVMRAYTAKANETTSFLILCGDSRIREDGNPLLVDPAPDTVPAVTSAYRNAIPLEMGISVITGYPYGLSAYIQAPEKDIAVQMCIVWIGPSGDPKDVVATTFGTSVGSAGTAWKRYICQGIAPAATSTAREARYMIPGIYITNRIAHTTTVRSAGIHIAGVMAYLLGKQDTAVAITPPDRYLTVGDPGELMGMSKTGFEGYIIGSTKK